MIYPDLALRRISKPIEEVTPEIHKIISDMWHVMDTESALGLSAIQINVPLNIVTIRVDKKNYTLINPEYIFHSTEEVVSEEGCISIPGYFDRVLRSKYIKIKYNNKNMEPRELEADNLLSFVIQHEMDHLYGILFVDKLSELKRIKAKTRVKRFLRKHKDYLDI